MQPTPRECLKNWKPSPLEKYVSPVLYYVTVREVQEKELIMYRVVLDTETVGNVDNHKTLRVYDFGFVVLDGKDNIINLDNHSGFIVSNPNTTLNITNSYVEINKVRIYGLRIDREYYGRFKCPDMSKDYIQELLEDQQSLVFILIGTFSISLHFHPK